MSSWGRLIAASPVVVLAAAAFEFGAAQLSSLSPNRTIGLSLSTVAGSLAEASLILFVGRRALAQTVSPGQAINGGVGLLGRTLFVNLAASVLVLVGVVLCFAPALIVTALFTAAIPFALLDGRTAREALETSFARVRPFLAPAVGFTSIGVVVSISLATANIALAMPQFAPDVNLSRGISLGLGVMAALVRPLVQLQQLSLWAATRPAPTLVEQPAHHPPAS